MKESELIALLKKAPPAPLPPSLKKRILAEVSLAKATRGMAFMNNWTPGWAALMGAWILMMVLHFTTPDTSRLCGSHTPMSWIFSAGAHTFERVRDAAPHWSLIAALAKPEVHAFLSGESEECGFAEITPEPFAPVMPILKNHIPSSL
jgi:hypothetical protein